MYKRQVQEWFNEYKENADIQINPMPEGLPYAVDMSKYTPAEGSTGAEQNAAGDNADGSAEGTTDGSALSLIHISPSSSLRANRCRRPCSASSWRACTRSRETCGWP